MMPFLRLLTILFTFTAFQTIAAPGDTIIVKTHENQIIRTNPSVGHTSYIAWRQFPSAQTPIHKVLLRMSFRCPQGENCGEWDYLNYIYLRRTGSVNNPSQDLEIARFITPYGNAFNQSWNANWEVELTDFEGLFKDSVEIEYRHTGYEASAGRGWLLNMEFVLIEGTVIRPYKNVQKLWGGSFEYGAAANPINNQLSPQTITLGSETRSTRMRIIQTGHGFGGPENCAEFCPKYRYLRKNDNLFSEHLVWRDDCGINPVFPQAGTWVYNRTGWCPGDIAFPQAYDFLTTPGSSETYSFEMQQFTNAAGQFANYVIEAYVVEFGEPSFNLDASVEEIYAPSPKHAYKRFNPICGQPKIRIRNNGKTPLTSLRIEFGTKDQPKGVYQWTGNLTFMQEEDVTLSAPMLWFASSGVFEVEVKNPNGQEDEYALNNKMSNPFIGTDVLPNKFVVNFRTNNRPDENGWYIYDTQGNVVVSKTSFAANTEYRDTVDLSNGCYQLVLEDSDGDGISWWANNDGSGFFRLRRADASSFIKTFGADFGASIVFNFTVGGALSTSNLESLPEVELFPNPANSMLSLRINSPLSGKGNIQIMDINGRLLIDKQNEPLSANHESQIDISQLAPGTYFVRLLINDALISKRFVIAR